MQKNKDRQRTVIVFFSAAFLLIASAYWLLNHDAPERLGEVRAYARDLTVIDGILYGERYDLDGPAIWARPVSGGAEKVIVKEKAAMQFQEASSPYGGLLLRKQPGGLIYAVTPKPASGGNGVSVGTGGARSANRVVFLGRFLAPAGVQRTAANASAHLIHNPVQPAVVLRSIDAGAHPRDIATLPAVPSVEADIAAYIHYTVPERYTLKTRNKTQWTEMSGNAEVGLLSLHDGRTRFVPSDALIDNLTACSTGAFWTSLRRFPDSRCDLHYVRAAGGKVFRLGTLQKNQRISRAVEFGGRLYCILEEYAKGINGRSVISLRLDGTDWQNHSLGESNGVPVRPMESYVAQPVLFARGGKLYCPAEDPQFAPAGQPGTVKADRARAELLRIRPAAQSGGASVEVVRKLYGDLGQFQVDQNFLYFVRHDALSNPVPALIGDYAPVSRADSLWRVPLP